MMKIEPLKSANLPYCKSDQKSNDFDLYFTSGSPRKYMDIFSPRPTIGFSSSMYPYIPSHHLCNSFELELPSITERSSSTICDDMTFSMRSQSLSRRFPSTDLIESMSYFSKHSIFEFRNISNRTTHYVIQPALIEKALATQCSNDADNIKYKQNWVCCLLWPFRCIFKHRKTILK